MLDNFDNLQASWVTQGGKVGQLSLAYGANDMGSVMIEENVVRAAGASYCMDEVEIVRNIEDAGFAAKRRNMHYEILGDPIFREREVPRMLELATAREDGDTQRARRAASAIRRAAAPAKPQNAGWQDCRIAGLSAGGSQDELQDAAIRQSNVVPTCLAFAVLAAFSLHSLQSCNLQSCDFAFSR